MNTMTFIAYETLLNSARNVRAGKPVQHNTRLFRRADDCIAVRLHNTDVVTHFADGRVTLDTGGWQTVTTKERLNGWAPVIVSSERGVWYVKHNLADDCVPYFDGITFDANGNCVNGISPADWKNYIAERNAMKKRIKSYVQGFDAALARGDMPMPSGGDCWGCCMRSEDGSEVMGSDHLLSHLDERYYVPSLAVNALRAKGYQNTGIYFFLSMDPENNTMGGERYRCGDTVRKAIRDYLSDRLLPKPPGSNDKRAPVRAKNTNY